MAPYCVCVTRATGGVDAGRKRDSPGETLIEWGIGGSTPYVVVRITGPRDAHVLIPRTCGSATLHGKGLHRCDLARTVG